MKNTILILGKNGMVGNATYKYLDLNQSLNVYGTTRKSQSQLKFSANKVEDDFRKIIKKYEKINYVINCIGIKNLDHTDKKQMTEANSLLPKKLDTLANKYKFKVIHISTDAVFHPSSSKVIETDKPNPIDIYGLTKFLGEANLKNTICIRTSLIGFSPDKKTGLIEWTKNSRKNIDGFSNQKWSGCTALQFAKLCEFIITHNNFVRLRKISGVFHFAPLGPTTKFELVSKIAKLTNKTIKVSRSNSNNKITRYLSSKYFDNKFLKQYTTDLNMALKELIEFENL